jgi:integrase
MTVRKRGKTWTYWAPAPKDPETGKRKQHTKGGFPTKKMALEAKAIYMADRARGIGLPATTTTVGDFLDDWLQRAAPGLRETTVNSYTAAVAKLKWELDSIRLRDLTSMQVQKCADNLLRSGGRSGKPLKVKTVRNVVAVLKRALRDAEALGQVSRNVAAPVSLPKDQRPIHPVWSASQMGEFLEFTKQDRFHAAFVLMATTGMRRGEVLGLRWSDLDLEQRVLQVEQTLTTVSDKPIFGRPKSEASRRQLSLDDWTVGILKQHRKHQIEEREACGDAWGNDGNDLVFSREDGSLVHPDRFSRRFKSVNRESGVPMLRGPHDVRHSYATIAIEQGQHPNGIKDRLGHATIAITMDTYGHRSPEMDRNIANVVSGEVRPATS